MSAAEPKFPPPDPAAFARELAELAGKAQAMFAELMKTPTARAAFGLEPLLLQSAWFRPHNRSEDLPGLYMVGAGTHPGAGIPGVLMSAKALESVLPPLSSFAKA